MRETRLMSCGTALAALWLALPAATQDRRPEPEYPVGGGAIRAPKNRAASAGPFAPDALSGMPPAIEDAHRSPPPGGLGGLPGGFLPSPAPEVLAEAKADLERVLGLRRRVEGLARAYLETPAEQRSAMKGSLLGALGELLDAKLSNQEHRARRLEEEAARTRETVSRMKASREKIVERKLEHLIDSGGWEW